MYIDQNDANPKTGAVQMVKNLLYIYFCKFPLYYCQTPVLAPTKAKGLGVDFVFPPSQQKQQSQWPSLKFSMKERC